MIPLINLTCLKTSGSSTLLQKISNFDYIIILKIIICEKLIYHDLYAYDTITITKRMKKNLIHPSNNTHK